MAPPVDFTRLAGIFSSVDQALMGQTRADLLRDGAALDYSTLMNPFGAGGRLPELTAEQRVARQRNIGMIDASNQAAEARFQGQLNQDAADRLAPRNLFGRDNEDVRRALLEGGLSEEEIAQLGEFQFGLNSGLIFDQGPTLTAPNVGVGPDDNIFAPENARKFADLRANKLGGAEGAGSTDILKSGGPALPDENLRKKAEQALGSLRGLHAQRQQALGQAGEAGLAEFEKSRVSEREAHTKSIRDALLGTMKQKAQIVGSIATAREREDQETINALTPDLNALEGYMAELIGQFNRAKMLEDLKAPAARPGDKKPAPETGGRVPGAPDPTGKMTDVERIREKAKHEAGVEVATEEDASIPEIRSRLKLPFSEPTGDLGVVNLFAKRRLKDLMRDEPDLNIPLPTGLDPTGQIFKLGQIKGRKAQSEIAALTTLLERIKDRDKPLSARLAGIDRIEPILDKITGFKRESLSAKERERLERGVLGLLEQEIIAALRVRVGAK